MPNRSWTAQDSFVAIVPTLFIAAMVMFVSPTLLQGGDELAQIAAGRWMIEHGTVPHSDPFSYTFAGRPWNAHEWLSEVIMAAAYRAGGISAIYALFGLAASATALFLATALLRFLAPLTALFLVTPPLAYLAETTQARPHMLALPILVLLMGELLAARQEQRAPSWVLVPLIVLWANLHGSFVLGLFLLAWFTFEAAITGSKWAPWAFLLVAATLATLLNPAGISGLLFPFKLMGIPALSVVSEWQSAVFVGFGTFEAALLLALGFCLMRGVTMPLVRLLLLLGLLHEALQHRRHIMIAVLLGAMLLAEPIAAALSSKPQAGKPAPWMQGAGALVFLLIISVRLAISVPLVEDRVTPIAALAHVPDDVLRQPVFNDWDLGAYLLFNGIRPFIDGRVELYGDAFIANYGHIVKELDAAALKATFTKYGIVWAVFPSDNPFNAVLDALPGWRVLYRDKFAVVHVRTALSPIAND